MTQGHLGHAIWLHSYNAKMCGVVQRMQVVKEPDMQGHMRSPRSADRQWASNILCAQADFDAMLPVTHLLLLWQHARPVQMNLQAHVSLPSNFTQLSKTNCCQNRVCHVSHAVMTML